MIEIHALKNGHTLYNTLRELVEGDATDINIIGLDDPLLGMNIDYYRSSHLYSKPFFLYLEEISTFTNPDILKHANFRGFISHIKSVCCQLYTEYGCKVYYLPLSSSDKNIPKINNHIKTLGSRPVNLIAWGSWNDVNDHNFLNRGGTAVDSIVTKLLEGGSNITLTIKTNKPLVCKERYPDKVNVIHDYLPQVDMESLYYQSDLFLLPSKQVHSASLVNAMSFGIPCIVSNGWGMDEYCNDINSFNINDFEVIKEIISNPEELKTKRINTLAYNLLTNSRESHRRNLNKIWESQK